MKGWGLIIGGSFGFLAVALGAFGAHALKPRVDSRSLEIFETAVRYQMYHALALVILGVISMSAFAKSMNIAGPLVCWTIGVLIFSGSLYTLVFTGVRAWGAVTPLGGLLLLAGWLWFTVSALRAVRAL